MRYAQWFFGAQTRVSSGPKSLASRSVSPPPSSSLMDTYSPPTSDAREQGTRTGTQHERVETLIFEDPSEMAHRVALRIATLIEERQAVGKNVVLGLPTGSTPIGVYQELIRMHEEEGLDFSNVVTFNLDEYYPMDPEGLQSYHRFMAENLFDHVNIPEENIHIPRGDIPPEEAERHCVEYEHAIEKAGGIDLMLLGIGRSGHVGFNEPGSSKHTRTRKVILDEITRKDAASDFFGEENVPQEAITMGVGTILDCDELLLLATGEHKAPIVQQAVEEPPTHEVTDEEWDRVMQVNVKGVFYCTKHAVPYLREAGGGSIINLSSIYGLVGGADVPPYHASKGAVRLMTKTDALLYADDNIRVNSVHPGFIWTPMVEAHLKSTADDVEEARAATAALHPLGHMGAPDDIAYGILYLAADESKFMTGAELVIDGGYTAR